ncbi:MAG: MMPL family transporter [Myxococcales bacterium]|nr:MMPL family transporter [Myxococcales bacterium]
MAKSLHDRLSDLFDVIPQIVRMAARAPWAAIIVHCIFLALVVGSCFVRVDYARDERLKTWQDGDPLPAPIPYSDTPTGRKDAWDDSFLSINAENAFDPKKHWTQAYKAFVDKYPSNEMLFVEIRGPRFVTESPETHARQQTRFLRNLSYRVEEIPGVSAVEWLGTISGADPCLYADAEDEDEDETEAMCDESTLANFLRNVEGTRFGQALMRMPSETEESSWMFYVILDHALADRDSLRAALQLQLAKTTDTYLGADPFSRSWRFVIYGVPAVTVAFRDVMIRDGTVTLVSVVLVVLFLCLGAFGWRNGHLVLGGMAAMGVGVVYTYLPMFAVGNRLEWITAQLPVTVILAGMAGMVHILHHYLTAKAAGAKTNEAIEQAARAVKVALPMTVLSTCLGLMMLGLTSDNPAIQRYGTWSAAGMLLTLFTHLTLLPAVTVLVDSRTKPRIYSPSLSKMTQRVVGFADKKPTTVLVVAAFILGASGWGGWLLVRENRIDANPITNSWRNLGDSNDGFWQVNHEDQNPQDHESVLKEWLSAKNIATRAQTIAERFGGGLVFLDFGFTEQPSPSIPNPRVLDAFSEFQQAMAGKIFYSPGVDTEAKQQTCRAEGPLRCPQTQIRGTLSIADAAAYYCKQHPQRCGENGWPGPEWAASLRESFPLFFPRPQHDAQNSVRMFVFTDSPWASHGQLFDQWILAWEKKHLNPIGAHVLSTANTIGGANTEEQDQADGLVPVNGLLGLWWHDDRMVKEGVMRGLLYTILVIIAFLVVVFWNSGHIWVSTLPNILPLVVAPGLFGLIWLAWPDVTVSTLPTAALFAAVICLGIIVDDTLYFLSDYLRQIRSDGRIVDSGEERHGQVVDAVARSAGLPIVVTSVALIAGFALLAFSPMIPLARMGTMIVLIVVSALASDLMVLPALLRLHARRRPRQ